METMEEVLEVKTRHLRSLMDIDGVVGVGIGMEEKPVIVVNVEAITETILSEIPKSLDGFAVRVEEVGTIRGDEDEDKM